MAAWLSGVSRGRASTDTAKQERRDLHLVTPGDVITEDMGYMRGHGTYVEDDRLIASVAGVVERVNKLVCVRPIKSRYNGEVGDVVVGRILEVGQKRWRVDTGSKLDSILNLSSINLPGGELRRRSAQDELMMRDYFQEGDLISAEVQMVHSDGALSLHTRSLKYGKLTQGTLLKVSSSLVKRCKTHFHSMLCGASIILGNNGWVWVSPQVLDDQRQVLYGSSNMTTEASTVGGQREKEVTMEERETIARLHNCILALVKKHVQLYDTSIQYTYDASLKYSVKELLKPDVAAGITVAAQRIGTE